MSCDVCSVDALFQLQFNSQSNICLQQKVNQFKPLKLQPVSFTASFIFTLNSKSKRCRCALCNALVDMFTCTGWCHQVKPSLQTLQLFPGFCLSLMIRALSVYCKLTAEDCVRPVYTKMHNGLKPSNLYSLNL